MSKRRKVKYPDKAPEQRSFWYKLFRFFFPKNFGAELRKGMQIGQQPGQTLGKAMFQVGKGARKVVDPEHKLKVGKNKTNEAQQTQSKKNK